MTLRLRIISLVSLFAILLIAAFTALLLGRQLKVITENNLFRARVGTFAAKSAFERTLATSRAGNPAEAFQKLLPILQEGQLAEEVSVADLQGKMVAATQPGMTGVMLTDREQQWAESSAESYSPKTWFRADVQPEQVTFYTPITLDEKPQYVGILSYSLGNMGGAIAQVSGLCALVALAVVAGVVPLCLLLIRSILGPIRTLGDATKSIASGNLSQQVDVVTDDELGELAQTFNGMAKALVVMKARAENANPLTKLPGNNVIHEEIEKRIKGKKKFVAVYSDLDNFKAFNDKYGIGAGDVAIKLTAQVMKEAIKKGAPGDFLGHEGGDDFILLTTPEKSDAVTGHVCTEFDKKIRDLYSPEDRERGKIVSKDREGNVKEFALMTISLAGVSNAQRELASYAEVTNICAEVKKKAKMLSKESGKSSFVLDKRTGAEREVHVSVTGTEPGAMPSPAAPNPPPAGPSSPPAPEPTPPSAPH